MHLPFVIIERCTFGSPYNKKDKKCTIGCAVTDSEISKEEVCHCFANVPCHLHLKRIKRYFARIQIQLILFKHNRVPFEIFVVDLDPHTTVMTHVFNLGVVHNISRLIYRNVHAPWQYVIFTSLQVSSSTM